MTARQTLSARQIYALARRAGLTPANATTATAVALAESTGRSWVTSPNPDGGTNVGIWQLDTPGGEGAGYSVSQLQDPWTNAQVMAKTTSGGTNWGPWQTFTDGSYMADMGAATAAATAEPADSQASGTGGSWVSNTLKSIWSLTDLKNDAGAASSAAADVSSLVIPPDISAFFDEAESFLTGAAWFLNPSNDVRVLSGFAGGVLLVAALVFLVKAA
jgi:Lysozyme like domain